MSLDFRFQIQKIWAIVYCVNYFKNLIPIENNGRILHVVFKYKNIHKNDAVLTYPKGNNR